MAIHPGENSDLAEKLAGDFTQRLEASLRAADRERVKHRRISRVGRILPLLLLVGPLVAWRLMEVSPDGVHVVINTVAWTAFLLDVGVHIDSAVLTSLNLQAVPTIVGVALALVLAIQFLWFTRNQE